MAKGSDKKVESSGKLNIGLIAGVAVMAAAVAGGGVWFIAGKNANTQGNPAMPLVAAAPIFVPIEPLTVNLQAEDRARYLRIGVTVKVSDARAQELMTQYAPEARNRMFVLLSNRRADSLLTAADKNQLASDIMKELSKPYVPNHPAPQIASVMFTEFVVQ
jgi:flagellar FliL protein